ncbi:MAG: hypothetical protein PHP13_06675 [Methanomicrobium sp.]|nr:hypothetical protein [Methanomicrobium sp.]
MEEASMKAVAKKLGDGVIIKELVTKKAHLKNGCAKTAADVLGWDMIVRYTDQGASICYSYYEAQPPLIGITNPVRIQCPLGLRSFEKYNIDFKKAIDIFHTSNCGDLFTEMKLYFVLHPEIKEPYWYIRSNLGCVIVIGADSGKIMEPI